VFADNTFQDTGHFQLYHSGVRNVVTGHSLARMEGMWSAGMVSGIRSAKNNSLIPGALAPLPAFLNEFTENEVTAGHRAPHQPDVQSRDTFWSQEVSHNLASFGISGQGMPSGRGSVNRFLVFKGNRITGGNGIGVWGLGNGDVLVERNTFSSVSQPITYDYFPDDLQHPTVQNVVLRNNTPALPPE